MLQRALEFTFNIENEQIRAEALAALTTEQTRAYYERLWKAAGTLSNSLPRIKLLHSLLGVATNSEEVIRLLRDSVIEYIQSKQEYGRDVMLNFCAGIAPHASIVIPPEALVTVAQNIIEIGWDWHWQ